MRDKFNLSFFVFSFIPSFAVILFKTTIGKTTTKLNQPVNNLEYREHDHTHDPRSRFMKIEH